MSLQQNGPLSIATHLTVELAGLGPVGVRRVISDLELVQADGKRRLTMVTTHDMQGWVALFNQWSYTFDTDLSLTVREHDDVMLTMAHVLPTHFSIQQLDAGAGSVAAAIIVMSAPGIVFSRWPSARSPRFDRYLPASARHALPLRRGA